MIAGGTAPEGGTVADIRRNLQNEIAVLTKPFPRRPKAYISGTNREVPDSYKPPLGEIIIFR